jgi:hypothetical protein
MQCVQLGKLLSGVIRSCNCFVRFVSHFQVLKYDLVFLSAHEAKKTENTHLIVELQTEERRRTPASLFAFG